MIASCDKYDAAETAVDLGVDDSVNVSYLLDVLLSLSGARKMDCAGAGERPQTFSSDSRYPRA
jgi:hypothetical protein